MPRSLLNAFGIGTELDIGQSKCSSPSRMGRRRTQEELWGCLADGLVVLHTPQAREWERMQELMRQYSDTPMDLADASVVAAAEELGLVRVFTLDSHFHAYRISGKLPFEVVP
jgi:hypothetical protein